MIGLAEEAYLKAGFLIYLVPLFSLFTFAFIADWTFNSSETVNVVAAILGLFIGFWWARRLSAGRYAEEFQAKFMRRELID